MIIDLNDGQPTLPDAEVVIVGGGTVALVLGVALHRRGVRTLVLESGGFSFDDTYQKLNEAAVTGRPHAGVTNARARVVGGTSTLWGGQLARFRPEDFDGRPGLSDAAWPIGYDDVAPYYTAVSRLLRLPESMDDDAAVRTRLGDDADLGEFDLFFTRWLKEPNLFKAFAKELEASSCVTLCLHAHVTQLLRADGGSAIAALALTRPDGSQLRVPTPTCILANGTLEIARTLLVSAQRDPQLPFAGNRWIGASFQDHLDLRAARINVTDKARFSDLMQNIVLEGHKHQPKLRLKGRSLDSRLPHVAASVSYESSLGEHLQYAKVLVKSIRGGRMPGDLREAVRHARGLARVWWPMASRYFKHRRIYNPADRGTFLTLHCEQVPQIESRISLDGSLQDRFGSPRLRLDWRVSGRPELEAMRTFALKLDEQLRRMQLASLDIDEQLRAADPAALDKCIDTYHQCGGARMGRDASDGVVDKELRVFGVPNLYVAGAACYRTSSYANPTFTAMALALRLVDTLGADQ